MTANIGLVDDVEDQRETVERMLNLELPSGWNIVSASPPATLSKGIEWIRDNDIAVLLLDEKLSQRAHTPYSGHDLANALRRAQPDFPVFIVTSFPGEDDLLDSEKNLDGIVSRDEIKEKTDVWVRRFTRAGLRFAKNHQAQLARLTDLSTLIAQGEATAAHLEEAKALQGSLEVRFTSPDEVTASAALDELERAVKEAEELQRDLKAKLRKKKVAPKK